MSNGDHKNILETKRVEIIQSLNFERTLLLNYLRSNHVFDEEDCELIMAEKASRGRAGKLIDFLLKKGPDAYQHFLDVIQVENATLFESLTGDKATKRPSSLMKKLIGHELKAEEGSKFPMQIMADHLQRTYADLHDMSLKFTSLLNAKNDLEEKLSKSESDLQFEKERRSEYEKIVTKVKDPDEFDETSILLLLHECDGLQKGIADRDVYIVVLQMKLLAEKEECEKLRNQLEEIEHKNGTMVTELHRVSENYRKEKGQSRRLSECIRLQGDEIHKVEELKKKVVEAQNETILVQDELDRKTEELKELTNCAEALKARFDIVEKEKYESLEKNENIMNNVSSMQESLRNLRRKLVLAEVEAEDYMKRKEILEKDSQMYRKQRDSALEGRKEAILERDKVISEKEIIQMQYNELQNKRDRFNEERATLLQDYDALEKRYKSTLEDLGQIKRELYAKEMEAEDLNRLLTEAEEKNQRNSRLLEIVPLQSAINRRDEGSTESDEEAKEQSAESNVKQNNPFRQQRLKSLLQSMKLRISGERSEVAGNMNNQDSPLSEARTLQVLRCLLPNLSSRPYSSAASVAESLLRLKRRSGVAAVDKAKTFPTVYQTIANVFPNVDATARFNFKDYAEKPFVDINDIPESFRPRSEQIRSKDN